MKKKVEATTKAAQETTKQTTKTVVNVVDNVAEGAKNCLAQNPNLSKSQSTLNKCANALVGKTVADATSDVGGVINSVVGSNGLLRRLLGL